MPGPQAGGDHDLRGIPRGESARVRPPGFGVYDAASDRATAIADTRLHRARFLGRTAQPPIEVPLQLLVARRDARLHDVRSPRDAWPVLYHPTDDTASMALGRSLRDGSPSPTSVRPPRRDPGRPTHVALRHELVWRRARCGRAVPQKIDDNPHTATPNTAPISPRTIHTMM